MKNRDSKSIVGRARDVMRAYGQASVSEITALLGLRPKQTGRAIERMVSDGEIRRLESGTYEWIGDTPDYVYCPKQMRVWRMLRQRTKRKEPTTVRYLRQQCGNDVSGRLISSYVKHLFDTGMVEKSAPETVRGKPASTFLVVREHLNAAEPPMMRRHTRQSVMTGKWRGIQKIVGDLQRAAFAPKNDIVEMERLAIDLYSAVTSAHEFADGLRQSTEADHAGCKTVEGSSNRRVAP